MSTVIPIQDLDTSTDPPSNGTIHAVVTLLWPYSSSTRQCALLLSERDFRLRARGGQIRVKFSGPAARAVAERKLGIGSEVVLELGSGQWVRNEVGVAVHVPGKSVGELQFGRGVRLRVQKEGAEDVDINVAEDAVDETEQEQEQKKVNSQVVRTPAKRTSSATNFRSSIGSTPGNTAIYSSPAYMRRAAKFSYLDGLSRLFEDEWENQDLPRKKARTSIGEVKSWRVVDRTPSPERRSSASVIQVDEEMAEAEDVAPRRTMDSQPLVEPSDTQAIAAEAAPLVFSTVSARAPAELRAKSPSRTSGSQPSPLEQLATFALEHQQTRETQASSDVSAYPRLQLPSASPTPQPNEAEPVIGLPADDPVTPRLLPLSSTALPSTTPQISPLATKLAFKGQSEAERTEEVNNGSQTVELPDVHTEPDADTLATPKAATEGLLEQIQFAPSDTGSAFETKTDAANAETMTSEASRDVDAMLQPDLGDLAEEDAFSDEEAEKDAFPDQEADETLSVREHDDEIMEEDDGDDVFDAAALGGERMSDEDTTEDREMYEMRGHGHQWLDESTTEKDSDLEEQQSTREVLNSQTTTQPIPHNDARAASQQPGFAPASTLLHATETLVKAPFVATETVVTTAPLAKPQLQVDRNVTSIEVTTPAAKSTDTPKTTPQSARDRVMKRTFSSLFGIKGTPSPEKEDLVRSSDGASDDAHGVVTQTKQDGGEQPMPESNRLQSSSEGNQQQTQIQEDIVTISNETYPAVARDHHAHQDAAITTPDIQPSLSVAAERPPEQLMETSPPRSPQGEDMLAEQQSVELISLDSESEEDGRVEEAAPDSTPSKPREPAPVPQRRPSARPADVPVITRDEVEPMSVASVYGNAEESAAPVSEPLVVDEPEITGQHKPSDTDQISPPGSSLLKDALVSQDEEHDVASQSELPAVSETIVHPDGVMADTTQQLPTSTFPESSAHLEPQHPALVESDVRELAQSESLGIFEGLEDIPGQIYDAEMHIDDPGHSLEDDGPASVLLSQEAMEVESLAAAAAPEQSLADQGLDGANHSAEQDIEMLSDDPALREPSQASFRSQLAGDDLKVQDHGAQEASSRPVSRDTIEDFSPVVLGSMSQRIANMVSNESAAERLQELQSQEDVAADEDDQEAPEISAMTDMIDEAAAQPTPTRAEKHTEVIDVLSSPSESYDFSPVRLTRSTQEQSSTFQPQDALEVEEKTVIREQADGFQEGTSVKAEENIEVQLQTPDNTAEQRPEALRKSLSEINTQASLADDPADVEELAHITPALSPSAIDAQMFGPAGVSHANVAQAAMQPTPMDTQIPSDLQPPFDHGASKASEKPQMSQANHHEEQIEMPPPEQAVPPKTPARKSFRSRLSNVPDVISAWFSPKRSSIVAQQPEKIPQVEKLVVSTAEAVQPDRTPKKHVSGISTSHAYYTSLASLEQHLNSSSQHAGAVDILAIVTDCTKEPERAKGGPRDYYTVFKITDQNMPDNLDVRVEVFRPWKAVLPAADVGDVVLLRAFVVKSKKRQPFLLSTDTSGWCVWRFAEHSKAVRGPDRADGDKPVWARRMSHGDAREEVKGPPVEYGVAEKERAKELREWWNDTHGEPQGTGPGESVRKGQEEDSHAIEL